MSEPRFALPAPKATAVERNPWVLLEDHHWAPFPPVPPPVPLPQIRPPLGPEPVSLPPPEPVLQPLPLPDHPLEEAERAWYGQAGVFESRPELQAWDDLRECSFDVLPGVETLDDELPSVHHSSGSEVHLDRSLPASASWSVVSHPEASVEPLSSERKKNLSDLVSHTGARVVDPISHLKLPWEHGLYKDIFESDPLTTSLSVPPLHVQDGSAGPSVDFSTAKASRTQPVARSLQAFKQHLDISYEDRVAKLAEVSIGKLVAFVEALPESCKPESWPAAYEECVSYLQACVGVKSPLTIEKRANSLLQYLRWAAKEGVCANLFSEEIFWC